MDNSNHDSQKNILIQEAIGHLNARRNKDAIPVLAQYLRINPNSEQGWFLMSYAISERDKKIFSLEKVLEINPENHQAQERLAKLRASQSQPDPTLADMPKPKNFPWLVSGVVVIVAGLCIAAGIWGFKRFSQQNSPPAATIQEIAQLATEPISSQTPKPTNTPTNTLIVLTETPTPSPTFLPSPTAIEVDPNVSIEMDRIQLQVSELRQLTEKQPVERSFIHHNSVRPLLEAIYLEQYSRDAVAAQARILSALGLIDPSYDLFGKTIDQLGEGIGGFYIPWKDELFVIGTKLTGIEKFVFAHEYSHALADQHYDFDRMEVYPKCLSETDRCSAISALIEGDATFLMYQWLEKYGSESDIAEILAAQYAPLDKTISASDLAPPYVAREINFRYGDGLKFVDYLYQIGRWQMINKAYETLPETTEQILHPEKYQVRETAVPLEMPDIQPILGDGWLFLGSGMLGELGTEMILGYSANGLSQIPPDEAVSAAAGWGGDNYQVYYRSTTNKHVLAVHWIWDQSYAYDLYAESNEFWNGLWSYMNLRYRGDMVDTPIGECWQLLNDHYSCIFQKNLEVLWVSSPDLDLLAAIRDQYPSFRPSE